MAGLFPEIEPDRHGLLEVGDGNLVYWETCGNPRGKPAVLHGGPGSGARLTSGTMPGSETGASFATPTR